MLSAMDFDYIIVGAGLAGLSAADELVQKGARVCVLEAADRVGGRVETVALNDGTPVDLGGQWLGPSQNQMYALCRRFSVETYPSHTRGQNILELGGSRRAYRGHIPYPISLRALGSLGANFCALER